MESCGLLWRGVVLAVCVCVCVCALLCCGVLGSGVRLGSSVWRGGVVYGGLVRCGVA